MFHRRFFPRQTISLPAWIEVNSSRLLERCKLMDLSESGARLGITDVRICRPNSIYIWPGSASLPINVNHLATCEGSSANAALSARLGVTNSHSNFIAPRPMARRSQPAWAVLFAALPGQSRNGP